MRYVDLDAPGYYFLTTDTPNLMRWLVGHAQQAGVEVLSDAAFTNAEKVRGGFDVAGYGTARYLVGADGPNSQVAKSLGLGQNREFLHGLEYEFAGLSMDNDDRLHCFLNRRLAPGYIGWIVPGVGTVQIGLARRMRRDPDAMKRVMAAGHAVADYLHGKRGDPHPWFARSYPRFRTKRALRFLFDHFQSDAFFNIMLATRPMRSAASLIYFHRRGGFSQAAPAQQSAPHEGASLIRGD
ncbi:MAG: FAD-dependent monooxygenase [Planctomycetales bacterium]|nr:FAD-dependent monooxygenase [Planctomycetales bacterium]